MRILVLTPTFFPIMGGAEKGIYEIYRRLAGRHQIRILTPWQKEKHRHNYEIEEQFPLPDQLEIVRFQDSINLMDSPGQGRLKGLIPPFSLSVIPALLRTVQEFNPDIINVFYALPYGLGGLMAQKRGKTPVLLSLIGRDVPGPQIPPLWAHYSRKVARALSEVLFISRYCRQALFPKGGSFGHIVPFGVDTERFQPGDSGESRRLIREKYGLSQEGVVLFCLQRLDRWKRVDIILKAFKLVAKKKDAYLIIGGKGPEKNFLLQLAHDLKINSRVIFTGYITEKELPLYFRGCDVFVFHSTYETFGLVLVQAMACGAPVVSVSSTAIPELVHDRRTGLCVEPLNPEALAKGICLLLENQELAQTLAREALALIKKNYEWKKVANQYEAILKQGVLNWKEANK